MMCGGVSTGQVVGGVQTNKHTQPALTYRANKQQLLFVVVFCVLIRESELSRRKKNFIVDACTESKPDGYPGYSGAGGKILG